MVDGAAFLETRLNPFMEKALEEKVFSGAAAGVCRLIPGGEEHFTLAWGRTSFFPGRREISRHTLFDLASLTKPLATTLAILALEHQGRLGLDDQLTLLLEEQVPNDKKLITLRHLLNHCSGLPAHRPYFIELIQQNPAEAKEWLLRRILAESLQYKPETSSLYSDLGFILLGLIVEKKSGLCLDDLVCREIMAPAGLGARILFNPRRRGKEDFAATEVCPWRGRMLEGEVHDENTFALGGVSGQAGLFADIDAVLEMVGLLLRILSGRVEHPSFAGERLRAYCTRQNLTPGSTWALGFDTPSLPGSSAGRLISANSVGHLGFTGTSFWIDREKETAVVLLTNRVHPSRQNDAIKIFRPLFHNTVFTALEE